MKRKNQIVAGLVALAITSGLVNPIASVKADTNSEKTTRTTYTDKIESSVKASYEEEKTADWMNLWTIRTAHGINEDYAKYAQLFCEKNPKITVGSTAANDMKLAIVTGNTEALNNLATKADYAAKSGQYTADYCLMALDENNYYFEGEKLAESLADYAESSSQRDDLVYVILNTAGCWSGGWWTLDTGCQNAQALVPYYNTFDEVKEKLNDLIEGYYKIAMEETYTDAASAGEYIRFAAMMGDIEKATAVYDKFVNLGEANWKFKGNAMDISRMARGEAYLNNKLAEASKPTPVVTPTAEPTPEVTPTATVTPTAEPTPVVTPTATATPTAEPTPVVTPTVAPTVAPEAVKSAEKKVQTVVVKVTNKTIKKKSLKKTKKYTLGASADTKLTYKVLSGKKYISVSKKGIVSVKKGIKKGTYKIQITASENDTYAAAKKTVKLVIK